MSAKVKYPRADALKVARQMCVSLADVTERLIVAGSLRRRKLAVGDVEVLFIPKLVTQTVDFFTSTSVSAADLMLNDLVAKGILAKRKNVNGSEMWGPKNKLAVHVASGIPVDLFAATAENWFNYLVCRTGSAENNLAIASAAQAKGWKWNPYGSGFSRMSGLGSESHVVSSERDVFDFVGLPYKEPWER
jgi:DNA polymerase/3'-5' exonuclease PolX